MADQEHVEIAKRGAAAIAEWQRKNPDEVLDLSGADLRRADLSDANLRRADLSDANLRVADLSDANLSGANLSGAKLSGANLMIADLGEADLRQADLCDAYLIIADLSGADLSGADLGSADLGGADLSGAKLGGADLGATKFFGTNLKGTNLSDARVYNTTFARCDLSPVSGLETVRHEGPSVVGTDTLLATYQGAGIRPTPELRGFFIKAGVPASLLEAIPGIANEVRYHTAFIAYGEPDRPLAERLYRDLQSKGVSCWTYAMDHTPGEQTWREVGQKRREAGKFIVLCSVAGLVRDGPKKEIEEQMDDDREKIIPISRDDLWRADGFEIRRPGRDLKPFLLERNYVDFSPGADHAAAFEDLLKALELRPDAPST